GRIRAPDDKAAKAAKAANPSPPRGRNERSSPSMRSPHDLMLTNTSRRSFLLLAGAGLCSVARAAPAAITARQVVERIQKNVGVTWRSETVDTFKIGNPETIVKGI